MKAPRPAADVDAARLRATAGFVLHAHLAGRALPEHLAELPDRMVVDRLARMDAKEVLATLQELYEIPWWDRDAFERVFVRGALEGWRPGSLVQSAPAKLRVVSTSCPIAAEVAKDPRACDACRALQRHAAYLALIGQVEDVRVDGGMSRGESACELEIVLRGAKG